MLLHMIILVFFLFIVVLVCVFFAFCCILRAAMLICLFFFFHVSATTEIYTYLHALSLLDALPFSAPAADAATNEAAALEAPGAGTGDANAEHGAAETGGQTAPVAPTTTR